MDVAYKTAFANLGTSPHKGVILSGFENYLHYQIKVNVTITNLYVDRLTVNVYVGATTYIKQLNINYFVMISGVAGGKHSAIQVLTGSKFSIKFRLPYIWSR